jgi:hypothetical protein
MLRRSERVAIHRQEEIKKIFHIFKIQMKYFEETYGKKKLLYYENICRLFISENNYFKYDRYYLRQEVKYDTIMRNFLVSAKLNKELLEGKKEVFILMKKEKKRILYYIERTIHFIEKYLNKKTELLKKTVLNEDVIREIIAFL